jgi:hypothetical protein
MEANNNVQLKLISFDVANLDGIDYFIQTYKSDNGIINVMHTPVESLPKELKQRQSNIYVDLGKIGEQRNNLDIQESELKSQITRIEELIKQADIPKDTKEEIVNK